MQLKKYMLLTAALITLLFTGPSPPSQPDIPGQSAQAPEIIPGNAIFQSVSEQGKTEKDIFSIEMVPDETNATQGMNVPPQADLDLSDPTASFVIDYIPEGEADYRGALCLETPEEVKIGFDYAASIWAATIHSTVPITIRACWALSLGWPLGYSSAGVDKDFPGAPLANTYYSHSLANALHGSDLTPAYYDINITYNSQYYYYYGLDATPPENRYDFVTLALHEIGHGLNFAGIALYNAETQQGFLGSDSGYVSIFDTFMVDGDGTPLTSYTSPSSDLGVRLISEDLWFLGPNAMAANGGSPVKMYAPPEWKTGSSYSHLDMDTFDDTINNLMVFAMSKGSANHDTGPVTRGLLKDLGWPDRLIPYPPEIVWASDETFDDKVRISWSTASCATYYEVHRKTTDDPVGTTVLIDDATESAFDDVYATPGDTYYYWVKACNSAGCSEFSASDAGTRGTIPVPEAPTNVNASNGTYPDEVRITWDEPGTATYYIVYRDINDGIYGATLLSDVVLTNEYSDSPAAEFIYFYWVRACNAAGCSGYSDPDPGYITPTKPLPPTGLTASDGTYKDKVAVSWKASDGAKNYMLYRNTTDSTSGAELLVASHTATLFEDTTASPETDYYYWVRACDSGDCSGYSSSDLGYLQRSVPEKPVGVTASDGLYIDRVHLSWGVPDHTDYFRIFRNTTNTTSSAIEMENAYPINSYDDMSAITEAPYYYFIKACNSEGCSSYSTSESGYAGYPNKLFIPLVQR